jgi:hypothetical protein
MLRRTFTARISNPLRVNNRNYIARPASLILGNGFKRGLATTRNNVTNPWPTRVITTGILGSVSLSLLYASKLSALETEGNDIDSELYYVSIASTQP